MRLTAAHHPCERGDLRMSGRTRAALDAMHVGDACAAVNAGVNAAVVLQLRLISLCASRCCGACCWSVSSLIDAYTEMCARHVVSV